MPVQRYRFSFPSVLWAESKGVDCPVSNGPSESQLQKISCLSNDVMELSVEISQDAKDKRAALSDTGLLREESLKQIQPYVLLIASALRLKSADVSDDVLESASCILQSFKDIIALQEKLKIQTKTWARCYQATGKEPANSRAYNIGAERCMTILTQINTSKADINACFRL